jgi:hypothetical protein
MWKRTMFRDQFSELQKLVLSYEHTEMTVDQLIIRVNFWAKGAGAGKKLPDVQLEAGLRREWMSSGEDIEVLRKYSNLGMTVRQMGAIVGVSGSAITRWLNGSRTKRS